MRTNGAALPAGQSQGHADSLPGIDISTAISFNQFYGWGVSKESQALRDTLNTWLKGFMKTKAFQRLVKRYVAD